MTLEEFDRAYANEQLRRSRSPIRKLAKAFYLRNVLADVTGPTIDLGCGAGQLLRKLPPGSIGIEVNPILVQCLRDQGMEVFEGFADAAGMHVPALPARHFQTVVMSHLLEHFEYAEHAIRAIFRWAMSIGIIRIIVIVPGRNGFRSDVTHKTLIDRRYVKTRELQHVEGFRLASLTYFPGNIERLGNWLKYHEMKLVFDRSTFADAIT